MSCDELCAAKVNKTGLAARPAMYGWAAERCPPGMSSQL